ncbi:MAG: KEOPS complex N(6)-L-threonylcarbamoyladenine synthase Kae1 [Candidatus Woesearchaeota archaeon]|jgi:glycoprotease/Kae1 family metallohydrolase|nr:KEOPS complex N(6)-L-threonylcarbamoyladenine synthase Kae1 [Candidatus Woesearchaeota archaeon]MDP7181211.1 KEOPS complex N(6)-L-threonylcarbamoyladenine synthase Kae1 [Candidatus Woesearchaeota archaeon]MDP7198169.1 KEOPS complex N(6)-L-threonylcarbamoyladenine synthase Kae1 [Candidatus Woesearchaeota archaeon]MDP7467004.1 KEOPS complex N(6)-L-threonylcarbamoyladenine synthase Kae1 [Candidatus Woesearchaeota archaeon]MDP7646674.1 KEOPS complex N(6)-L-threonylcarbamoyladenine synthase Kae1 |tara:strand:+ start:346 stop:1290 length:945 start_codon:yes stop_codon:yes gene_type:complete
MKYCLGIEGTAHTIGAGIVSFEGNVIANEKEVYTSETGMIPTAVAEHHKKYVDEVIEQALKTAKLELQDISLISYSAGPGIAPCLHVASNKAQELGKENNIPVVGINHCVAHLTIGQLSTKMKDPVFLYVAGANTQVICLAGKFRIFGETLDIGLGNALDKFGREKGLGFPAGPKIEQLAKKGKWVDLPYSVKGMDVSFSGIITKASRMQEKIEDVCYSLQETCFAMLTEVAERALAHAERDELCLIGGVGANKRLAAMLNIMCKERGAKFAAVPLDLAGDQGAMIAWQGILEKDKTSEGIRPYERTDDVDVTW